VEQEGDVEIQINFEDDKGRMVPIRGSPYTASFNSKAKAQDNQMTGGAMTKYIQRELDKMLLDLVETKK